MGALVIVKVQQVQRPSLVGPSGIFIYNEAKTITYETFDPDEVTAIKKLIGNAAMVYAKAYYNKSSKRVELNKVCAAPRYRW